MKRKTKLSTALSNRGVSCLWYITHINNLDSILERGILCRSEAQSAGLLQQDISLPSVQWRRAARGGINAHQFVPLFLAANTPMLYVTYNKYPGEIALLHIDLSVADKPGVMFTDGNLADQETTLYRSPADLSKLNWGIILSPYGAYSSEWKRVRSAEVLIPGKVETAYIRAIHMAPTAASTQQGQAIAVKARRVGLIVAFNLSATGITNM